MQIGEVIRKYRKAKDMTQEELANRLGVTAPAVNKWENGNTMPDITLLAPISRLLDVSLNELLSFREELTKQEILELTDRLQKLLEAENFETAYAWAKNQLEEFPNCDPLISNLVTTLYYTLQCKDISNKERYDDFILSCYERLLKSSDSAMRLFGANAMFDYYFGKQQYEKAQTYLSHLSDENPEKKRRLAKIYEKTGETDKAYCAYEEILFSCHQQLSYVFNSLFIMEMKNGDIEKARYYAEKKKALVRLFEMGEYNIFAADLELVQLEKDADGTIACVRGLLENLDTLYAFTTSPLYAHMTFKEPEPDFIEAVKKGILESLKDDSFSYMQSDPRWEEILAI